MHISPFQKPHLGKPCTNSSDAVTAENNFGTPALELPLELAAHLMNCLCDGKPVSAGKRPNTMWGQLRWGIEVVIGSTSINVMKVLLQD